jgi:SAM-dependent methyltransferase
MAVQLLKTELRDTPDAPAEKGTGDIRGKRESYWDGYYAKAVSAPLAPSQFAAFVAGEFPDTDLIVDIGCGNGRDSIFFANLGYSVIGIDASASAIQKCRQQSQTAKFINCLIADAIHEPELHEKRLGHNHVVAYSRFFLHAIDHAEEEQFWGLAQKICMRPGDALALEFRNEDDSLRLKETGLHYRRYPNHDEVVARAQKKGFVLRYETQGRGFAKYKNDDAVVSRLIFEHDAH